VVALVFYCELPNSRNCCLDVAGAARSYEIIALLLMSMRPE
jgi:hypothetical protein